MPELPLIFQGMRWPAAKDRQQRAMVFGPDPPIWLTRRHPARFSRSQQRALAGAGRRRRRRGFWRDLAEIDLNDAKAVLDFVHRRGDPDRLLDDGAETHTGHWFSLADVLAHRRAGMGAAQDERRCVRITGDPGRIGDADFFLRDDPTFADATGRTGARSSSTGRASCCARTP